LRPFRPKVTEPDADNTYHSSVAFKQVKIEHAGAKNGGGARMTRAEAKQSAKRKRRQADKRAVEVPCEKETLTGEPMPDVAAAVRCSRESH